MRDSLGIRCPVEVLGICANWWEWFEREPLKYCGIALVLVRQPWQRTLERLSYQEACRYMMRPFALRVLATSASNRVLRVRLLQS